MIGIAATLIALAAPSALPEGFDANDRVVLDGGITFLGATLEDSAPEGGDIHLELVYQVSQATAPLSTDLFAFVHLESLESECRIVEDRRPPQPVDGIVRHAMTLRVPTNGKCAGSTLEVYTGLYDRRAGPRVAVVEPRSMDDRIHAASIDISAAGTPAGELRTVLPSDMSGHAFWAHLRPWYGWLIAVLIATALTILLARRTTVLGRRASGEPELPQAPPTRRERRIRAAVFIAVLGVPLIASLLAGLDFIKDDAYISFRYARNLVDGHGLVFNPGERVEGITNFLWTVLMAPFEALKIDLFILSEWLGLALWAGILVYLVRLSRLFTTTSDGATDTVRSGAILWGGVWLATSSSMAKWSHSGMEQALAMFLPILAAWLLWRRKPQPSELEAATRPDPVYGNPDWDAKGALWSGIFMGLGCTTRPEIHAIALCLGLPLLWRVIRERRISRPVLFWFAGLFAIVVPFHAFRYAYYGSLVPNTFYVKTGNSSLVWLTGLQKLREMFGFNVTGVLAALAPLAFIRKELRWEKLVSLAIAVGFMVFIVKVGVDEMEWHRLYLPALPFLVLLASTGLMNLFRIVAAWAPIPGRRAVAWSVGWFLVAASAIANFGFTYREMGGFNGRGDLSGNYHPDLGKFITRHERPRALVAFQDMGSTPYYAPDLDFLDFIGLVDSTVAHARYNYGLHAFMATESAKNQPKFDAEMRGYFYERNPEWTILTTYIPGSIAGEVSRRFAANPNPEVLEPYLRSNGYQFGIVNEEFNRKYVHVRTWPRSAGYYLSLYRRKDLWVQTPREVVLDAVPANLSGPKATFERGVELLGAEIQPSTKQRYEAFFTTWWRLPGPLPPDTWIFFHVERTTDDGKGYRAAFDTLPGDFMYPADRWQPGQILEHRVLFQVPWDMRTGTYKVVAGIYFRGSGQRLPITTPAHGDGQDRIELGTLTIESLNPPFDDLIPQTRVEVMRKYPERIMENGRKVLDP